MDAAVEQDVVSTVALTVEQDVVPVVVHLKGKFFLPIKSIIHF